MVYVLYFGRSRHWSRALSGVIVFLDQAHYSDYLSALRDFVQTLIKLTQDK